MKRIIKIFSVVLLMFILVINAKAVTITTNSAVSGTVDTDSKLVTNTGMLSITNITSGDTFNCYKVLDVFYNSTTNNITYEFTSTFQTFLNNASGTIEVSGSTKNISALTVADYQALTSGNISNGSTTTSSTLDILMSKYTSYIKTNNVSGTAMTTNGTIASTTIAAGSYLVLPSSTQQVYAVMVGNVEFTGNGTTWTLNNATIVAKKSEPSIVLDDSNTLATRTSYVPSTARLTLPTYPTNATNKTLTFELNLGSQFMDIYSYDINNGHWSDVYYLQINNSQILPDNSTGNIIINNEVAATASYNSTNNKLTINFDITKIPTNVVDVDFDVRFNVNNFVLGPTGNTFETKLIYANDPYGSGTTYVSDTKTIYTYGVKILKTNGSGTPLPGAEFYLECLPTDGTATTDANGYATFDGFIALDDSCTVYETKAPTGYKLDRSGKVFALDTTQAYTTYTFVDQPLASLPATGGSGTYIYTIVGLALMGSAVILFMKRKKKIEEI